MDKKPKKKKIVLRVLSVLLIIILIFAVVLGYRFRNHIKSAIIWLTTSDEDIQKNIDEAKDVQSEILNNSGFNASKELDEALMSGKISAEQHTQILLGNLTLEDVLGEGKDSTQTGYDNTVVPEENEIKDNPQVDNTQENDESQTVPPIENDKNPAQTDGEKDSGKKEEINLPQQNVVTPNDKNAQEQTTQQSPAQQTQTSGDADKLVAELITKMYVLKSEYTGAVEGVIASMKAEYVNLPPEQRTTSTKQNIALKYLSQITSMETQCDAQVNAIVTQLRQILKANGRDMSLADAILSTYATEKANTKAYYLSIYGD